MCDSKEQTRKILISSNKNTKENGNYDKDKSSDIEITCHDLSIEDEDYVIEERDDQKEVYVVEQIDEEYILEQSDNQMDDIIEGKKESTVEPEEEIELCLNENETNMVENRPNNEREVSVPENEIIKDVIVQHNSQVGTKSPEKKETCEDELEDDDMFIVIDDMCCEEENHVSNDGDVEEELSDVEMDRILTAIGKEEAECEKEEIKSSDAEDEMDRIITEIGKEEAEFEKEEMKLSDAEDEMDVILEEIANEEICLQNASEERDSNFEALIKERETDDDDDSVVELAENESGSFEKNSKQLKNKDVTKSEKTISSLISKTTLYENKKLGKTQLQLKDSNQSTIVDEKREESLSISDKSLHNQSLSNDAVKGITDKKEILNQIQNERRPSLHIAAFTNEMEIENAGLADKNSDGKVLSSGNIFETKPVLNTVCDLVQDMLQQTVSETNSEISKSKKEAVLLSILKSSNKSEKTSGFVPSPASFDSNDYSVDDDSSESNRMENKVTNILETILSPADENANRKANLQLKFPIGNSVSRKKKLDTSCNSSEFVTVKKMKLDKADTEDPPSCIKHLQSSEDSGSSIDKIDCVKHESLPRKFQISEKMDSLTDLILESQAWHRKMATRLESLRADKSLKKEKPCIEISKTTKDLYFKVVSELFPIVLKACMKGEFRRKKMILKKVDEVTPLFKAEIEELETDRQKKLMPILQKAKTRTIGMKVLLEKQEDATASLLQESISQRWTSQVRPRITSPSVIDLTQDEPPRQSVFPVMHLMPSMVRPGMIPPLPSSLMNGRTVAYVFNSPPRRAFAPRQRLVYALQMNPTRAVNRFIPSLPPPLPAASTSSGLVLISRTSKHPAPLPNTPFYPVSSVLKALPPKPSLKGSRAPSGIILSWNMNLFSSHAKVATFQLYAYQEAPGPVSAALWKKVGDVKALPLPMACTLTQFVEGHRYYFAVRAVDAHARLGPFSDPVAIIYTALPQP